MNKVKIKRKLKEIEEFDEKKIEEIIEIIKSHFEEED